jgi:hypothetical protein
MARKAAVKRRSKAASARKTGPKRRTATSGKAKSTKRKTIARQNARIIDYPVAETLNWIASGEKLLVKWGAIKSPGAKRIANTVGQILLVLEALTALRKPA